METLTINQLLDKQAQPLDLEQQYNSPFARIGFEGLDRRFSDVGYHFTRENKLASIERTGLKNINTLSSPDWSEWDILDNFLMIAKPPDINIDLEHIVFGQLEQNELGTDVSFALRTGIDKGESVAIAIDTSDTYVSSPRMREEVASFLSLGLFKRERGNTKEYVQESFWRQVMTLSRFRELYEPDEHAVSRGGYINLGWYLKDPNNEVKLSVPSGYGEVELFIPIEAGRGAIPVERLAHTASSLVGRAKFNETD